MEREVKLAVQSLGPVSERLHTLGEAQAQRVSSVTEHNYVLDTSDTALKVRGERLRIREIEGRPGVLVTWKCPASERSGVRRREERQFHADDRDACVAVLSNLGLRPVRSYDKIRDSWQVEGVIVCLDTLPFGFFVELEFTPAIPEESEGDVLRRVVELLGLQDAPRIQASYARLQQDWQITYPSFARHLEVLRPQQAREPEIRFETVPGIQVQADWAHFACFPLGDDRIELYGLVVILGYSRAPALRFATDRTRQTTFACLLHCLEDLGGVPHEILTDRDPAFCIGSMSDGRAILAPEWVDLCGVIGSIPRACRPYRAKTKGKVERMVRETKESMLPWLSGQFLPSEPTLADYDRLGRIWIDEIVLPRRHRTTKRVVADAWSQERPLLAPVPNRLLHPSVDLKTPPYPSSVIDLTAHRLGEHVQVRDLAEYEVAL